MNTRLQNRFYELHEKASEVHDAKERLDEAKLQVAQLHMRMAGQAGVAALEQGAE